MQEVPRKSKKQRGFTLVELLVVISIMGLLMGIAVVNFRGAEGRNNLNMEAERLSGVFREAQNYAVAQKRIEYPEGSGDTIVPSNGYSVYFHTGSPMFRNKYMIYADIDDTPSYGGDDVVVRIDTMLSEITLERIESAEGDNLQQVSVNYQPPNGGVTFYVDDSELDTKYLLFNFRESDTEGASRTIKVYNETGIVEIE